MLADPPIADLSGGEDADRNAAVASLKSLFYAPDPPKDLPGRRDASRLSLMLDVPLCRWSFEILPHQQAALNVFQPQYTHMFEALLSRPPPHYYVHVLLPGGTQSLGQPEYELKPGTEAPLAGTLMEVIHVRREPDSRLSLIVRGLSRGVVVRATQASPGALARPDAGRQLLALCRCVDALGRCGVDTSAARVHAWVDDEMSGTRDAPVAHLVAVEPLGPADDDALAAALSQGPMLVYRAVEAE